MSLPPIADSSTEVGPTTAAPDTDAPGTDPTDEATPTDAGPARLRRIWDRVGPPGWTLRSRLVVLLVALLIGVSLTIGVISTLALQHYLIGQLDDKVDNAAARTLRVYQDLQNPPDQHNGFGFGPGTVEGTVIAKIQNGKLTGDVDVLTKTYQTGTVAGNTSALASVPADTHEHTRDLGGDLGKYRLRAVPVGSGTLLVTGLPMKSVTDATFRLAAIITLVTLVFVAVGAAIGAVVVRLTLRPLRRVAATAQQVSELQLDRGEVALGVRVPDSYTDRRTEVGQVGAALNAMLGHVAQALTARQASETRVRRFVADASHELRTPLAAIRGYAELSRRSQEPIPADVAHALDRVESQTIRMTGLVEDLLLLASLDSGRPILVEPVDLSVLLVGALSDAHAAGPDHRWRLDLPEDSVIVPGEGARLTQVVVNLLGNARTHTPAGTTVTAGLATQGPDAVITVVDDGPGIPSALQPEVFERFARGDSSRSRAAGSTGLGLSIVAAVVAAHHGTVQVSSVPGRTIFTVSLPMQRLEPGAQAAPVQ
ncbi:MAG TPA: HAMP domain-containing sensor histidine kinase [Sporichthyaceae bacterium]|nr:HAMP domain-containing sensor histidine kinase [Sporichthyaceae bacterium]